jgi:5'-3' exonuclease
MSVLKALIDADIVAYRCAATCESDDQSFIALDRCNTLVERILNVLGATDYHLFLSGDRNFRYEIDPQYKAHRKDKPRPKWLQECREFLVKDWQATVTDGIEADDALGINQGEDTFICTIDKDLLQVPGNHYNWVKEEEYFISEEEGLKNFWSQTIVGDIADNIFGIKGLGPIKTAKLLANVEGDTLDELDKNYYKLVDELYNDTPRLHRNCKLLWIQRSEGDIWLSPDEKNPPKKKKKYGRKVVSVASSPVSSEQVVENGLLNTNV